MSLKSIGVLFLAACEGMDECETVHQEGPGLSGFATYMLGDGSRLETDLGTGGYARTSAGTITIHGSFTDAFSRKRTFELDVTGMSVGTFDLEGRGSVCMQRMTNGAEVCSPLTGTIEVRALDEDCYWHESGVGSCAETIDFTIHAESVWETTQLVLGGEMQTVGSWVTEEC